MTVSSQTNNVTFVGNGVATSFPLPFRFFSNGDIRAYFIDSTTGASTPMALGVDYTLIGAGEPEVDGNAPSILTTTVPLASLRGLYVERVMPQVQETDIVNQGEFFAATHEDVFDRLTMLIQQADSNSKGAIRVAIGDPEPARLPPAASRALHLMGFDSEGDPISVVPTSDSAAGLALDLINNTDPAKGAALVGFKRTVISDKIGDVQKMLTAQAFSLWEFEDQITVKPNPADFTTWDWAPAVQAAINAPSYNAQHTIEVPRGIRIASTVTVNNGVKFVGSEPFDYNFANFVVDDPALVAFRIRAHFVVFDGIVIEGPGKVGTGTAIEVGDGVTNQDKFAFINDSYVFSFNVGIDIKTQNWSIRQGSTVSTCAIGVQLSGMPTTADRRNGYIQGANIHSCDIGINVPVQWQVLGITDCDFNSCGTSITGNIIRSIIANNLFFNGTGSDLVITASIQNVIEGNFALGNVGVAAWTAPAFSITGETTIVKGNNIRNKGGHGIYAALTSSIISNNITVDCDFYDTTSFDGIHVAGANNNIVGNVSRATTGGASRQRYGINVASGSGNLVALNTVNGNKTAQINAAAGTVLFKNPGFVTENKGIASLGGGTSVTVNHGLAYTPTIDDITVTPITAWGAVTSWYIDNPTSSTFRITVSTASSMQFAWRAAR